MVSYHFYKKIYDYSPYTDKLLMQLCELIPNKNELWIHKLNTILDEKIDIIIKYIDLNSKNSSFYNLNDIDTIISNIKNIKKIYDKLNKNTNTVNNLLTLCIEIRNNKLIESFKKEYNKNIFLELECDLISGRETLQYLKNLFQILFQI